MGAGVLPFALTGGRVAFLMQTVFEGRKSGLLNDFGGGSEPAESAIRTAAREFVEETETLYFAEDAFTARRTPESVQAQLPLMEQCLDSTLAVHPGWWRRRASPNPLKPKDWKTYFVQIPYRNVEPLNRLWEADSDGRFRKRRQLHWLPASDLVSLYRSSPERLWKRVRQLEDVTSLIMEIRDTVE